MKPTIYEFEGQKMTIAEVHAIVPVMTPKNLAVHLKAGRNTRQAILTHTGRQQRQGGRGAFMRNWK